MVLNPKGEAEAYYNRALTKANLEDNKGELSDYFKAIEIDPYYASAYYNIAIIKDNEGDNEEAIKYYGKAIENDSAYADAFYNRGELEMRLFRITDACNDLYKAKTLGNKDADELIKKNCE